MQHEITCQQLENAEGNAEASESLFPLSAMESLGEGQKRCAKCKTVKRLDEFHKRAASKDGLQSSCRACQAEAYRCRYSNPENRARSAEANRRYMQTPEGRAKHAEAARRRYSNPRNRAKQAERMRRWRQSSEGRDWMSSYIRRRSQVDPQFRLALLLRSRLRLALKGAAKSARALELLGCSPERLIQHLESQFKPGMTWENQGKWHIDHIMPLASFDLTEPTQQRMACHWTNLQPLWADENIRKGAKVLCEK